MSTEALQVLYLNAGQYVELEWLCSNAAKAGGGSLEITRLPTPLAAMTVPASGNFGIATLARMTGPRNDPRGWWASGTPSRITVDQAGTYLVLAFGSSNNVDIWYYVRRNGTVVHEGHGQINNLSSASPCGLSFVSVHQLNAGDYLQIETGGGGGAEVATFAVVQINGVKAAMAKTTTGTTEADYPAQPTTQTFNAEEVDTDGFHSTTTNNPRVTVPAGKAGNYWAFFDLSIQSSNILQMGRNGSAVTSADRQGSPDIGANNNRWTHGCASWMAALAAGDYFTSWAYCVPNWTSDPLGTFLGLICLDDFVYEPAAWVPQVYRVKRP